MEDLGQVYPASHFDLVHMRNALDHTVRPLAVVESALSAVRPGGVLLFRHFENVHFGPSEHLSSGLHQWAITVGGQDGTHFVIENFAKLHNVTASLSGRASVFAWRDGGWIVAVIRKNVQSIAPRPDCFFDPHGCTDIDHEYYNNVNFMSCVVFYTESESV